jgi:membrane protein
LLFTIGKALLGLYLGKTAVGSAYGAAGSLIVVILWVYYSAMIFYFGAEFTRIRASRRALSVHAAKAAPTRNASRGGEASG